LSDDTRKDKGQATPLADNAGAPVAPEPREAEQVYASAAIPGETLEAEAAETEASGGRPSIGFILGAVGLLAAVGIGLALLFPPPEQQAFNRPTAGAQATAAVPTALPLPEAIGDPNDPEVIAQVGAVDITRGEFVRRYQPGANPSDLLDQLIQIELVVQAAAAEGVTVDEALIEGRIDQLLQEQAGGDEAAFEEFLAAHNIAGVDELRTLLGRDYLVEQMILRHTTAEQVRVRHILLAAESEAAEQRREEAEKLLSDIQGGADFAELARTRSDDTLSAVKGGDLGWAPRGIYVPAFNDAVFSMAAGEVRLVQTDFGWHIVEVLEPAEVRGFDDMALLNTGPGQQAFAETFLPWVSNLQETARSEDRIRILVDTDELVAGAEQN
jgi:peptidyl-prolyl cis-trans isomerase C